MIACAGPASVPSATPASVRKIVSIRAGDGGFLGEVLRDDVPLQVRIGRHGEEYARPIRMHTIQATYSKALRPQQLWLQCLVRPVHCGFISLGSHLKHECAH